jgi:hypothetical protein
MKGQSFYNGKKYILTQAPYISDCGQFYQANALLDGDEQNPTIRLYWNVIRDHEDESMCCNWNEFEVS